MGVLTVKSRNIEGWLLFKIKQINNTEEMKKIKVLLMTVLFVNVANFVEFVLLKHCFLS